MKHAQLLDQMEGSGAQWWAAHYAAVADLEAGRDAIVLSVGEINLPAPEKMLGRASARLLEGWHKYSPARGAMPLRTAIASKYAARTGRAVGPEHVLFANGAQGCLALMVQSLLDPGDEILIPEPRYITYGGIASAAGAKIVPISLEPENRFHLTADAVASAITPHTRALVLNSPQNPTGATLSREEVLEIGAVAEAHDLWILSDEVYEEFVYAGSFWSPFDDPVLAKRTFVISSISKSRAVPGWRCGWVVGPPEVLELANRLFEIVIFCAPPFLQDATAYALSRDFPESAEARRILAERAAQVPSILSEARGIRAPTPEGGIFVFADVRETGLSDRAFVRELYEAEMVSVMPGSAFGDAGADHVRICIAGNERNMREACVRICRFANSRFREQCLTHEPRA